jgi:hypothetical protein
MTNILRFSKKGEGNKSPVTPAGAGKSSFSPASNASNEMEGAMQSTSSGDESSAASGNLTFEQIALRNRENAERLRKERSQANKNVLRSYRIK